MKSKPKYNRHITFLAPYSEISKIYNFDLNTLQITKEKYPEVDNFEYSPPKL